MFSIGIKPQRNVVSADGQICKAWEFEYHRATFYVQETESGYAIVEEVPPGGAWRLVQPQRSQLLLSEFEHMRRKQRA